MKREDREKLGKRIQAIIEKGNKFKKVTNKSNGQNEATGSEGGNLVGSESLPDILSPNFSNGSIYADSKILNLGKNSNGMKIGVSKATVDTEESVRGGSRAYVLLEGATKTYSKAAFDVVDLKLKKMAVTTPLTDEIKQDVEALPSYISDSQSEAAMALIDYNIVHGDGSFMNGIASDPSTGTVSTTDPITSAELKDIFDLYYGGKAGKWYLSKSVWNQITDLAITTSNFPLVFTPDGPILWGYPVIVTSVMEDNEILLADMTQYIIIQKEIRQAVNESVLYLTDEQILRSVIRMNGQSAWKTAITLGDGSVVHPFVMSATFGENSSSSTSYIDNWSSSSSNSSSSSTEVQESRSSNSSSSSSSEAKSSSSSSSSSSSESTQSESTSSSNSESSTSRSSTSRSSTSQSSTSQSSESTRSSNSSSSSEEYSSSSSQSSGALGSCKEQYTASGFTDTTLNGLYDFNTRYNNRSAYRKGSFYLWYSSSDVYAISTAIGSVPGTWLATADDDTRDCPDGTYNGADGVIV